MNTRQVVQVGGVIILVCTGGEIAGQRKIDMHDLPHSHNETQSGPGYAMGRDAVVMTMGAGPSSGPPPLGNRAIHERIIREHWEAHHSYYNTEIIQRQKRLRVPA